MISKTRTAALLLSPLPGVASVLLGYRKLGFSLYIAAFILLPSLRFLGLADTPQGLIAWFFSLHLLIAVGIVIAFLPRYTKGNQAIKVPALMVLSYLIVSYYSVIHFSQFSGYAKAKISHNSSITHINDGEFVLQNIYFDRNKLTNGDIVSFEINGEYLEKRIHGIAGDNVTECMNLVFINGVANTWVQNDVSNQWQTHYQTDYAQDCQYSESFKVPNGYLYVLGDQSRNSKDSRIYGLVSTAQVMGKLLYVLPERISDFSSEQPLLSVSFSSNS
ncbi:signal peptidase I [Shewanella sp. 10N.286.45.A1]|uniref:signal peptidase I n=1 Tax=Shewanella sp. 10N.286.45.A1 TaxID=3229694 RepID=UPI0035505042